MTVRKALHRQRVELHAELAGVPDTDEEGRAFLLGRLAQIEDCLRWLDRRADKSHRESGAVSALQGERL